MCTVIDLLHQNLKKGYIGIAHEFVKYYIIIWIKVICTVIDWLYQNFKKVIGLVNIYININPLKYDLHAIIGWSKTELSFWTMQDSYHFMQILSVTFILFALKCQKLSTNMDTVWLEGVLGPRDSFGLEL